MDNHISKVATVLDIKTANDTKEWLSTNLLVDKNKGIVENNGSESYSWNPVFN